MDVLKFVKEAHKGQTYKNGVPYWLHLNRVANILDFFLNKTKEGNSSDRRLIFNCALLHDSLEDTEITKEDINKKFGEAVLNIVWELTDEDSEKVKSEKYLEKMRLASEEAKLIKLADLLNNIHSSIRYLNDNGLKWTKEFFFVRIDEMSNEMINSKFINYNKTSAKLKEEVGLAKHLLIKEIKTWEVVCY